MHRELGLGFDREGDSLRCVDHHRVGKPERELELRGTLRDDTVADAHDLELLLIALGDPGDHVRHEGAGQTVQGTGQPLVIRTRHLQLTLLIFRDGDGLAHRELQFTLGALDSQVLAVDLDLDAGRDRDREPANS